LWYIIIFNSSKKLKLKYSSWLHNLLIAFAFFVTAYVFYCFGTHAHFDPWAGAKIYPSLALANGIDLYQQKTGPFILTIYGPGSSLFYLPVSLGKTPEQCMWIAYFMNLSVLIVCIYGIFLKGTKQPNISTSLFIAFGMVLLLTIDQTTQILFKIHHDIPVIAYLGVATYFILGKYPTNQNFRIWFGTLFIWLAFWTKIVALPWLILPILFRFTLVNTKYEIWSKAILPTIGTGLISFATFSLLFGVNDLWFHLFESTNSYPWRSCNSLFGDSEEALVANDILTKLGILFRIMLLYVLEYWWLVLASVLILFSNFHKQEEKVLIWLVGCYFLVLPTCLSALAKFGGVANSMVFAHAPAFAAIFLQISKVIEKKISSKSAKLILTFTIFVFPAMGGFRIANAILKDSSLSPQQLGYEYLLENPNNPVFFALTPLPNYLATGKIWDSGESLTYSTMMVPDALPIDAGMNGPREIKTLAFGMPPYSITYFRKKFHLEPVSAPSKLNSWYLYRASPKKDQDVKEYD
jgi:hypothetical protein